MSQTGVGTILRRGQGANPIPTVGTDTFDVIGRVRNIGGPQISKEEVEDTTLDAAGGFKEYLSGMKDPGSCELALSWTPGTVGSDTHLHQAIEADAKAGTTAARRNWQIEWPDGTIADFQGEVFAFAPNTEPNSVVDISVTIRINGEVTYTYPT